VFAFVCLFVCLVHMSVSGITGEQVNIEIQSAWP